MIRRIQRILPDAAGRSYAGSRLEPIVQWGVVLISLGLVLRSLIIIHDNFLVAQAFDQWNLVAAMATDFASVFKPAYFFKHQNEHIIATSHAVFLLDYGLFDMRNILPITLIVVLDLVLAWLMTGIACGDMAKMWNRAFAALAGVAMLSVAQWQNLLFGFQVQFPLFLLFAILAISACEQYAAARVFRRKLAIGLAAVLCIGLCTVSFGAGLFLGAPLLFVLFARRARIGDIVAVAVICVIFAALFLVDYHPNPYLAGRRSVVEVAFFFFAMLGSPFSPAIAVAAGIGATGLCVFMALLVDLVLLPYLRGEVVERRSVLLSAICLYMLCFAGFTAWGRVIVGLEYATLSRYATPAFIFWIGIAGLLFRFVQLRGPSDFLRRAALSLVSIAFLTGFGFSTLRPDANQTMKAAVAGVNEGAFFALNDVSSERVLQTMFYLHAARVVQSYPFLREHRLSLFSPAAKWYVPPDFTGNPFEAPACPRWWIEQIENVAPGGWAVRGWALDPDGDANPEWILAFDRAGHRVGFTRSLLPRGELKAALHLKGEGFGFYLPIKLAEGQVPNGDLTLVAVDGKQPGRACRLAGAFVIPGK